MQCENEKLLWADGILYVCPHVLIRKLLDSWQLLIKFCVERLHRLEDSVFLGSDVASIGNKFPTFRESVLPLYSVHSSGS